MFDITLVEEPMAYSIWHKAETERNLIVGPEVPEGACWRLTSMYAKDITSPCEEIVLCITDGQEWIGLAGAFRPPARQGVSWSGAVTMAAGWKLGYMFLKPAQQDDLQTTATWDVIAKGVEKPKAAKKEAKGDSK